MGRGRVVLSVTAIYLFFDHLALDHKSLNSWGRRIGRGGVVLSGTAIFVPFWSSCFEEIRFMGRDLNWGGKWWHCLVHQSFSSILTPILWFFLRSQNQCLFACPDWGWKGWKTITYFGKMSGKRLENNPLNWWFLAGFFVTDQWQPWTGQRDQDAAFL